MDAHTNIPTNLVLENGNKELQRLIKIATQQTEDIKELKIQNSNLKYDLIILRKELTKVNNTKTYCAIL